MTATPPAERPPLVVVPPTADLAAVRQEHHRQGWAAQSTWALPAEPWDCRPLGIVCVGAVDDEASAAAALQAAVRGAGVVVALDPASPLGALVVDDLARVGEVEARGAEADPGDGLGLSGEQLELLRLVADGHTLREAAAELYLSTRTAERRLGAIRKALGVRSTAQAVLAYLEATGGGRP
jgi:DNA-binding CsgD family transcriptional regulator